MNDKLEYRRFCKEKMIRDALESILYPTEILGCDKCYHNDIKTRVCGRCRDVRYCSSECQKADWTKHKKECSTEKIGFRRITNEVHSLLFIMLNCTKKIDSPRVLVKIQDKDLFLSDTMAALGIKIVLMNEQAFKEYVYGCGHKKLLDKMTEASPNETIVKIDISGINEVTHCLYVGVKRIFRPHDAS